MIFKNSKVYDIIKWIATVVLPAITTLWLTIGQIWELPYVEPIGATLAAITTFVCALLGISSVMYQIKEKKDGYNKG